MNTKNIFILGIAAMAVFSLLGFAAAAENVNDDTGDVWHWTWNSNTGAYSWMHSTTNRPNVDITELSYGTSGQQIVLTLKVAGTIEDSEKIVYAAFYNPTDGTYYMTYANGTGSCMGISGNYTSFATGNVTVSGNTITGTINMLGNGAKSDFYGYAYEYTNFGDTSGEWWGDWAPQDDSPWYGTESDNDGGGSGGGSTPGFEILLALGAIALVVALRKK